MKIPLLLLLFASFMVLASCSKEEDAFTYNQADFYGNWELTTIEPEDFEACIDNPPELTISKNEIVLGGIDESTNCSTGTALTSTYAFNGSTFTLYLLSSNPDFTIVSKDANEFSWTRKLGNAQQTFTYRKKN